MVTVAKLKAGFGSGQQSIPNKFAVWIGLQLVQRWTDIGSKRRVYHRSKVVDDKSIDGKTDGGEMVRT